MLLSFALAAALQTTPAAADDPALLGRMVALYDRVCLQSFPADDAAAAAVTGAGGVPLAGLELGRYLYGRHGQGWSVPDGDHPFIVTIEEAPYHGCSIRRWTAGGVGDVAAYRTIADQYEAAHPGFTAIEPQTYKQDGVESKGVGEVLKADGASETLMLFSSSPVKDAASGTEGVEFRLIHVFHSAPAAKPKKGK